SSIDSDWSIKNKKQPGFLRLISAWYAMVSLHFSHHDSASLPGLDPESRAPVPCSANQTARQQQPCQRPASCKLACWRTFGGQPNRIRVGKGSGDVSETSGARPESTSTPSKPRHLVHLEVANETRRLGSRRPRVPVGDPLISVTDPEQEPLVEGPSDHLQSYGQAIGVEAHWKRQSGQPRETRHPGELHDGRQHVLFAVPLDHDLGGAAGCGGKRERRRDEDVDPLEPLEELLPQ